MHQEEIKDARAFYDAVAALLGTTHHYKPPTLHQRFDPETGTIVEYVKRPRRWGNRDPGNGRFEGFGLVRWFGPAHIQIALTRPTPLSRVCGSAAEAFDILRKHIG